MSAIYLECQASHNHSSCCHNLARICFKNARLRPGDQAGPQNSGPTGLFPDSKRAGLMPGSGKRSQCMMHLLPGFLRCLKDADRAQCWAHQISCGAILGSGLTFGDIFASLMCTCIRHTLLHKQKAVSTFIPFNFLHKSLNIRDIFGISTKSDQ